MSDKSEEELATKIRSRIFLMVDLLGIVLLIAGMWMLFLLEKSLPIITYNETEITGIDLTPIFYGFFLVIFVVFGLQLSSKKFDKKRRG